MERESLEESEPPSESEARLPAFPDLGSARIRVIFLLRGRPFNFGAVITNKLNIVNTVVPGFRVLGFRALKAGAGAWSVHKTLFGFRIPLFWPFGSKLACVFEKILRYLVIFA